MDVFRTTQAAKVTTLLCNIPNIDAFIIKRTAVYVGKISRSDNNTYPKKILAVWITGKRKNGAPQLTCNNNFVNSIKKSSHQEKYSPTNKHSFENGSRWPRTKIIGLPI